MERMIPEKETISVEFKSDLTSPGCMHLLQTIQFPLYLHGSKS